MTVATLREEIDRLNLELLALLSQRGRIVEQVGLAAKDAAAPHHPAREEAMLAELVAANPGPYPEEAIRRVFQAIFQVSLELKVDAQPRPKAPGERQTG